MGEIRQDYNLLCTIVVSSCDAYEELWPPFFKLLKIQWPSLPFQIVLNTETKVYQTDGLDIRCMRLYQPGENVPWSRRLKETLQRISSKYVLFLLDDFFIDGKVDENKIMECISWMENDRGISVFSFMETFSGSYDDNRYPGFERRRLVSEYKFNCQAALWRRKHLIQYLRNGESPWEWEVYGNWRSYRYFNRKFYSRKAGAGQIIPYLFEAGGRSFGGLVLFRGRWYAPLAEYFNEKYALDIDLGGRGIMEERELLQSLSPTEQPHDRAAWKNRLLFLRPLYHKLLRIKNILLHIKHIF